MNDPNRTTTDGQPADPGLETAPAPKPINPATGQHGAYWILSEEERRRGFVRPVRRTYVHRGESPKYPLRDLTPKEVEDFSGLGYVSFEAYPEDSPEAKVGLTGRYWTREGMAPGCGTATTMAREIAETYARNPHFYGATFCVGCRKHLPVEQFVWDGTQERVGS